jgi:hypothetical protein
MTGDREYAGPRGDTRVSSRIERLLTLIQATGGNGQLSVPTRLCLVCQQAVGVDGAGVSLISPDRHAQIAASDQLAGDVEELQAVLREGPCYDAVAEGGPVLAPDLTADSARVRWPAFAPSAVDAGVRGAFGFPLTYDGRSVGALDLYSLTSRSLSDGAIDDALLLADLTAIAVHDLDATGRIDEVGISSDLDEPWAHRSVVHHATGMTAVHLGVDIDEALLRLRAFAFASSRRLDEVASDVVARRLQLDEWSDDR